MFSESSSVFGATSTAEEVAKHFSEHIRGKNIIITGASPKSMGAEVVRVTAPYANLIVITGRSAQRLNTTKESVLAETPTANIRIVVVDFGSLASVRSAAREIVGFPEDFQVLFNNAATQNPAVLQRTSDGFEINFGVDHIAHFLFANLIMSKLVPASPEYPARIVTISSRIHQAGGIRWDDPNFIKQQEEYNSLASYSQAKSANLMFARALAKRGKLSFAVHPGTVLTNLIGENTKKHFIEQGWMDADGNPIDTPALVWKSLGQGTAGHIVAAFDPVLKTQSGSYIVDCQVRNDLIAAHAKDEDNVEKLWALTEEIVGEKFP